MANAELGRQSDSKTLPLATPGQTRQPANMTVEVAYATPDEQAIFEAVLPEGGVIEEAILRSGVLEHFPQIDIKTCDVGVFGKTKKMDMVLRDGDRVEIYRPLIADPKEVRRRLAKEGKTMGKKKVADVQDAPTKSI